MTVEQTGQNNSSEFSVRMLVNQPLSFETLLDKTCERLRETRQQGSIKRILMLEEILDMAAQELDSLCQANPDKE